MSADHVEILKRLPTRRFWRSPRSEFVRLLRSRRDLKRLAAADVAFVSYAKAGRTWTRVMISRLYQSRYDLPRDTIVDDDNFHRLNPAIPVFLFTMGNYIADIYPIDQRPSPYRDKKVIFLARHPADTAVSFYFHLYNRVNRQKLDVKRLPAAAEKPEIFTHLSTSPVGLGHVIDYMNRWQAALQDHPDHLVVRYEDLRAEPAKELARIGAFLGGGFTPALMAEAVEFADFRNLQNKERDRFFASDKLQARDNDNPDSYKVRRGKVGGYRDYLTADQAAWVEREIATGLRPEFGYGAT